MNNNGVHFMMPTIFDNNGKIELDLILQDYL